MGRSRLILATLALALWCGPALAAITNTVLGGSNSASGTTPTNVTSADCPPGSIVTVWTATPAGGVSFNSVTDSAGNSYSIPQDVVTGTGIQIAFFYGVITADLPSGGSLIGHLSSSSQAGIGGICIGGASTRAAVALDKHHNTATGTGVTTSPSVSTGALGQSAESVVLYVGMNGTLSSQTCSTGTVNPVATGASSSFMTCKQTVASPASVSGTVTNGIARNMAADIVSFFGTSPTTPPVGGRTMLGAGL